ncbi:hypothetical protein PAB09_07225 [Corynebacterium sp. SCR221107]|uniref:hypothetical protein n=1 Tax=Corynebacterium sp. SCR221107 TaxID=3017361 RepID=UPI0022EC6A4A|nr:hypothetical protein [Corynebacterium sp. SCR221107]WBT07734.1 hypothetical protein PAB09_07225 [Corynebacterium sp. SCR221107]
MKCSKKSAGNKKNKCCGGKCHCRHKGGHKKWSDLTDRQRKIITVAVPIDLALKATAWHFLYHLPKERIRGSKVVWGVVTSVVGTFGPLAFLVGGIKKKDHAQ